MSSWPVFNGPAIKRGAVREGQTAAFHRGFRDGLTLGLCLGGGLVLDKKDGPPPELKGGH